MARWNNNSAHKFTLPQQYLFLRNNPNCTGDGELGNRQLVWRYEAQATPLSRVYKIEIRLREGTGYPEVLVKDPNLQELAGKREIPHVYRNPLRLCLYLPRKRQWHGGLRLDQTIVPWTALWLYYFEEWLSSDEWKGGGEHPGDSLQPSANRSLRRITRNYETRPRRR